MRYVKLKEKKTLLIGISGSVSASGMNNYLFYLQNIVEIIYDFDKIYS